MTVGGWILLVSAWAGILGLTTWCLARVIGAPGKPEEPAERVPPTA